MVFIEVSSDQEKHSFFGVSLGNFLLVEVHQLDWRSKSILEGLGQFSMNTGKICEVWIRDLFFLCLELVFKGLESGIDVILPNLEFSLDLFVGKFDFMLVNELAEKISKFFILEGKTLSFDFFWTEHVANFMELISDEVENWCPLVLVSRVSHDDIHESILSSQVN